MRYLGPALSISLIACQAAIPPRTGVAGTKAETSVQVWLTTGDQRSLLASQPQLQLVPDAGPLTGAIIDVDPGRTYQEMIGFGAAMTDASAWLMQNRMSADDREALLRDLFARDSGIGMSFIRVPMGASDFSRRHNSYDDVAPSQSDSALAHFSIDPDRAEKVPILRRALAINPRLKVVASPWSAPAWMKT